MLNEKLRWTFASLSDSNLNELLCLDHSHLGNVADSVTKQKAGNNLSCHLACTPGGHKTKPHDFTLSLRILGVHFARKQYFSHSSFQVITEPCHHFKTKVIVQNPEVYYQPWLSNNCDPLNYSTNFIAINKHFLDKNKTQICSVTYSGIL